MKKLICLLLALVCSVALFSCGGSDVPAPLALAAEAEPTRITTLVSYTSKVNDEDVKLNGNYQMEVNGSDSIFTYSYERMATIQEANDGDIKTIAGKIYYKDGQYSTDGEEWESEAPTAIRMNLNLKAEYLTDVTVSEDTQTLTAKVSGENIKNVLGIENLGAKGDVSITVKTNGVHLTEVDVAYTTSSDAAVTVRTSYSYNPVTLDFKD